MRAFATLAVWNLALKGATAQDDFAVPQQCFDKSNFVNVDLSTDVAVTDLSLMNQVGFDRAVVGLKVCFNKSVVTGVQLSKAQVTSAGAVENLVEQETHGTLSGTGVSCQSLSIGKGKEVVSLTIYSTVQTITRLKVTQADKTVTNLGPSNGKTNTGAISFSSAKGVSAFYGFQSKSSSSGVLTSLGIIKYDVQCLKDYIVKAREEKAAELAAAAKLLEQNGGQGAEVKLTPRQTLIAAAVESGAPPDLCFLQNKIGLINDRGAQVPKVSDQSLWGSVGSSPSITSVQGCFTESKLVGI